MTQEKELHITRLLDADIALVWEAWTMPAHLMQWYAPEGCTIEYKSINVQPGGQFHSCIHDPEHGDCWIKGAYHEVIAPVKLVISMILTDEAGNDVTALAAGKPDTWPKEIVTTVTFVAIGNQTKIELHQTVAEAEAKKTGAYQSWFSMFDRLSKLLAENNNS